MRWWWNRLGVDLWDHFLPGEAFSVERDGLLCGCFLYVMETKGGPAGLVSHTIANPDRPVAGWRAIDVMMKNVKRYAIEEGFVALMCLTDSRLLAKVYRDNGFALGHEGTNQYVLV